MIIKLAAQKDVYSLCETHFDLKCLAKYYLFIYFLWHCSPARAMASSTTRFLDHTQRCATVGRTPLGRVISSSQRPLPDNTQQTNIHTSGGVRTHDRIRALGQAHILT